jgi:hypothetical protein
MNNKQSLELDKHVESAELNRFEQVVCEVPVQAQYMVCCLAESSAIRTGSASGYCSQRCWLRGFRANCFRTICNSALLLIHKQEQLQDIQAGEHAQVGKDCRVDFSQLILEQKPARALDQTAPRRRQMNNTHKKFVRG